ncbi:phosphotransferase family protein [Auraticoccus monumenti]|uniref:Phosphotransferase enzyme family protein n=1 Tax=Auraticoccus monumenti TaxID=675864 RepID=A0A1G6TVJ8_9ACTN|nr:aminoglycoside phosphotransferase family protein [Auraticoccus monumenti]SDD33130.1 Phosphotransferase enzyme family protein [Auraticoccus monumenti]
MDPHPITPDDACRVVAAALGVPTPSARRLAGSVTNQDFLVELADGGRVVVKTGPAAEIAAEVWTLPQARSSGVLVPDLLVGDPGGALLGTPLLVIEWLPGEQPPSARAVQEAGRQLRALHATPRGGAGPLVLPDGATGDAARGEHDTWPHQLEAVRAELDVVVEAGLLDAATARVVDAAARRLAAGRWAEPGVLLHGDLKADHVFSVGDRLTGVIDWGAAAVGDPWWDLARASMMTPEHFAALLDGYGAFPTAALEHRMTVYVALWNAWSLASEHRAGGDWFAVYQGRIARAAADLV